MIIKIESLNSISYVDADGKLDIHNAPDYLDKIKEHLRKHATKELILEFSKISFVASIGLRTILELYKIIQRQNGVLKLKNVNKEIMFTFKTTCFDKFLFIENDSDMPEEEETHKQNPSSEQDENSVNNIVKTELNDILEELNKWYYSVAGVMGCNDRDLESNIIQTLMQDDNRFNETLQVYEKISKDEFVNRLSIQNI